MRVATALGETPYVSKTSDYDKLQGSVAAYVRCGGVVNNQIKKGLLLSLSVKKISKSVNIRQSYKQERDCLVLQYLVICRQRLVLLALIVQWIIF